MGVTMKLWTAKGHGSSGSLERDGEEEPAAAVVRASVKDTVARLGFCLSGSDHSTTLCELRCDS